LNPSDPEAQNALAAARDRLTEDADKMLEQGLQLAQEGQTAQAHLLFKQAIELVPMDDRAWVGCAITADNLSSKMSYLNQALQLNPNNAEAQEMQRILTGFSGSPKKAGWGISTIVIRAVIILLIVAAIAAAIIFLPPLLPQ
jgi:hypothetical protein